MGVQAKLLFVAGPMAGEEFLLTDHRVVLGRAETSDVVVADPRVSRHHCEIRVSDETARLVDLGSKNRLFLNGTAVTEAVAQSGDYITAGDSVFTLSFNGSLTQSATQSALAVGSEDVLYAIKKGGGRYAAGKIPQEADRTLKDLNTLYKASRLLAGAQTVKELYEVFAAFVFDAFAAQSAAVVTTEGCRSGTYNIRASKNRGVPGVSSSVIWHALTAEEGVLCRDVLLDERFRESESVEASEVRTVLCAPISSTAGTFGAVYIHDTDLQREYDEADLELLDALATHCGLAAENLAFRQTLERENRDLRSRLEPHSRMIGKSPQIKRVFELVSRAARTEANVLLCGPSGTGKELAARAIHNASTRKAGPFIALNCAAIPESLLESELFGHEKGAFTGARSRKRGRFELATHGTILLDEIAEMSPASQAKLLRVLDQRTLRRLGGTEEIAVDARVIAATNMDIDPAVRSGRFREDLFYRLNVVRIDIPPLKERKGDIPVLVDAFLREFAGIRRITHVTSAAMHAMIQHDWPGNVRELRNYIERAVVLGRGESLDVEDLPPLAAFTAVEPTSMSLEDMEKAHIARVLGSTGWNKKRAAEALGIQRSTLDRKISRYGLTRDNVFEE